MQKTLLITILLLTIFSTTTGISARQRYLIEDINLSDYDLKYKGTIDNNLYISVFLNQTGSKVTGIYFYDNRKSYLTLAGTISKTGHCILFESNDKGKITAKFEGVLVNENFRGNWKKTDSGETRKFELINQAPLKTGDLGEAKPVRKNLMYIIASCLAVVMVGFLVYNRNRDKKDIRTAIPAPASKNNNPVDIDKLSSKIIEDLKHAGINLPKVDVNSNPDVISKKKGDDFEKFVISKVPIRYFKFKSWRSDKLTETHIPESNSYPDLEFQYRYYKYKSDFAIECKYRSNFVGGYVEICKPEKLRFYKQFQEEKNMDVYIMLGVGGEPTLPKDLFLIPLSKINSPKLHVDELNQQFLKPVKSMLFYKMDEHRLS